MISLSIASIKNSLMTKVVLVALSIVTIVFALLIPGAIRLIDIVAEEHIHNQILELDALVNSTLSPLAFTRNQILANDLLVDLLKQPDLSFVYILVYDNEGELLSRAGAVDPELLPNIDNNLSAARKDNIYDRQTVLKLNGETLGKVRYGLSLHKELISSDNLRRQGTFVVLSALLATAALFSLFGYGLTRKLKKLIVGTHAISAGDYTKKVSITSKDEIGQLSSDFNVMVDAIRNNNHEIQENKRFLQSITDNIDGMIYRCSNSPQFTLGYASKGAEKLTGYKLSELITDEGFDCVSLTFEEDRQRIWDEIQEAFRNSDKFSITYRIKTKEGEVKWIQDRGRKIENDESLIEGIMVDITAQTLARVAQLTSEEQLSNIVENSIQGICIQRDWTPLYVNKAFAKMLGYDSVADCLSVSSMASYISQKDIPRLSSYRKNYKQGAYGTRHYEFEGVKKDGSTFIAESIVTAVNWEGEPALQHVIVDISEQKKSEQQSAQYLNQLAQLNRVNILGEMAAGIAHEINQPLTSIITRSGATRRRLLTNKPDMAKVDHSLKKISQQALRAGEVMQRMRDLVVMHQSERGLISPNELIEESLKIVRIDNSMINTKIETKLSPDLPLVVVDKTQIQQVILNLLRNAQDTMELLPRDERTIILISTKLDENYVKITVSDSGEGINSEVESKLLNSFFTTKKTGMGMGLSISRTIITAHSGQLWFSRNVDRGVSFHFTIPTINNSNV